MEYISYIIWAVLLLYIVIKFIRSIRIVPTRKAYIVERLGKYSRTLDAGFHALMPFFDKVTYILDLREEAIDVPPQTCFTKDNVRVEVDGILYISVMQPEKAAYGITDYRFAAIQLSQTTVRSIIGTLELDTTFEERDVINNKIMTVLSEVEEAWGIKVHRYEVKNIIPPESVKQAMERQLTAERDRRAQIAKSESLRQSKINQSQGYKTELINRSEGEMQKRINEAEGIAVEIESIATATAMAIAEIAKAVSTNGGEKALQLQLSEKMVGNLRKLASNDTDIVLSADLMNVNQWLSTLKFGEIDLGEALKKSK